MNRKENFLFKTFAFYIILFLLIQISLKLNLKYMTGRLTFIIAVAVVWMFLTIPGYIFSKKIKYISYLYPIINAVITGMTIASYYIIQSIEVDILDCHIFGFILFMVFNYGIIIITSKRKQISLINIILSIIGSLATIYLWTVISVSLGSHLLFLIIIYLCFFIALYLNKQKDSNYLTIVNFASVIMFGGVFLLVLILITEGDGIEILDMSWWKDRKKTR
ncbi:hypothetical protein [Orenia marismortui]|uniref:Uncharacterized protein n=1 Tax=Orenia marismortui TaxID=46469 RepID=A0A4V3GX31_9FIRM|nr:hypothetical protein [Orenia marismortui]TDX46349.1 hypothetical protein C7959_14216 [Orenia marismortui]